MGSSREGRARMMRGFVPNGLLPNKAEDSSISIPNVLEHKRWSRAEERAAELLQYVQPNFKSEQRRDAVVSYLQRLITTSVSCQVFPLGSVPLKTYLPDGDIDLTALGDNPQLKNNFVNEVRRILENEEKRSEDDTEFRVKEVQFIQAEVKILKCLVENFVVDISFNQLGGLCTLCFLEEVDNMIGRNHIFKRSVILIKSWCYYESRILGSQHGLLSTYAVETLVIYIFHVYNGIFAGPLEVLYRFLEFFSKFDWDNYCISLWGPVPIKSLPNMRAERPRKDCKELMLSETFLNACMCCYGSTPSNQENQEQPFVSKYLNIVDPLRANNNLGRSINKGNFFRIRSAIAYGAQRLVRLLDCPEEKLVAEFDFFFKNTWDKNGNGYWIPFYDLNARMKNVQNSTHHEHEDQQQPRDEVHRKHATNLSESEHMIGTSDVSAVSEAWSSNTSTMNSRIKHANPMKNALIDQGQSSKHSTNEVHDMSHLARVHSIPEFTPASKQHRHTRVSRREISEQVHSASSSMADYSRGSSSKSRPENQQSFGQTSEGSVDLNDALDCYYGEFGLGVNNQNGYLVDDEAIQRFQKEYAIMNSMETFRNPSYNQYLRALVNASCFDSSWGQNMPYSQDFVPFPAMEFTDPSDYNAALAHLGYDNNSDGVFWLEQDMNNMRLYDSEEGNVQPQQESNNRQMLAKDTSNAGTNMAENTWQVHDSSVDTSSILAGSPSENQALLFPCVPFPIMFPFPTERFDVLDSDFAGHWVNMQLGMLCLHGQSKGPLLPTPSFVPPMHLRLLQHYLPWHVPGTLLSANMNIMAQSFPLDPVMPIGPGAAELPKSSRAGTGTYMPDPETYQIRFKSHAKRRNFRAKSWRFNYEYERGKHSDDESERSLDENPNPDMNYDSNERFGNHGQFWRRMNSPPQYYGSSSRGYFSGTKEDSYIGEGSNIAWSKPAKWERDSAVSSYQPSSPNISGDIKDSQPINQDGW